MLPHFCNISTFDIAAIFHSRNVSISISYINAILFLIKYIIVLFFRKNSLIKILFRTTNDIVILAKKYLFAEYIRLKFNRVRFCHIGDFVLILGDFEPLGELFGDYSHIW